MKYGKNIVSKVISGILGGYLFFVMLCETIFRTNGKPLDNVDIIMIIICSYIVLVAIRTFVSYIEITDDYLILKKGVLLRKEKIIDYKLITSIEMFNNFGMGGIRIHTTDGRVYRFKNLNKYDELKEMIMQKISNKNASVVIVK